MGCVPGLQKYKWLMSALAWRRLPNLVHCA